MRRCLAMLAFLAVVLALGACSRGTGFSMEGSYAVTIIVSETNTPGTMVGDVEGFAATITRSGDRVDMASSIGFVVTGTRSGNSVSLEGTDGGAAVWTFDLTWTGDMVFEGEGRFEDGPEYIEFEAYGFTSPLLAGE